MGFSGLFFDPKLLATGIGIGLLISAPVGPANILCIQRTLERGFWGGVAAGMGALLADSLLALIAAFGISAIVGLLTDYKLAIKLIGGVILLIFGIRLFVAKPANQGPNGEKSRLSSNSLVIPQTFFLTISNPGAIIGIFAVVGGAGVMGGIQGYEKTLMMVAAVMVGAAIWWFGLSWLIATVRHKLNEKRLKFINQVAGIVLILFGLALILEPYLGINTGMALHMPPIAQ